MRAQDRRHIANRSNRLGAPLALPIMENAMTAKDEMMSTSDILTHIKNGAELYRGFADKIELKLSDGRTFVVPVPMFDDLIDAGRIKPELGERTGFYRLA
jgi:hypothetical protein